MGSKETKQVGGFDFRIIDGSGQVFDPYLHIFEAAPKLIQTARAKRRKDGISYRDFYVGAATISVDEAKKRVSYFVGANYKPHPEVPKECAEQKALGEAKARQHLFTPAIFVAGTTNRDLIYGVTGRDTPTLHPCQPCRELDLLQEHTVVVTVGGEEDIYEIHTGQELDAMYSAEQKSRRARRRNNNPEITVVEHVIDDRDFSTFALARSVYEERVNGLDLAQPESRMLRAQFVVESLCEVDDALRQG